VRSIEILHLRPKAPVQDDIEREERVIEMEAPPTRERLEEFEFLVL
jgi:hypothetical protein